MSFFGLNFISLLTLAVAFKDPHFCDNRSVIVQLFGWKFLDIAKECKNFLGPKGYGGVQVEVRIYIDVVLNHMAPNKCLCYPDVPYTYEHFHLPECTIKNCSNNATEIRNCKLFGCPDLDQSDKYVKRKQVEFLNLLIRIGVAGFRISHAKHMWPMDLEMIYKKLNNLSCEHGFPPGARPFIYHHVVDDKAVSKWEYNKIGCVEERNFSLVLSNLVRNIDPIIVPELQDADAVGFLPSRDAIVRVDDPYTQRGIYTDGINILTYKNSKLYKIAVILMLCCRYGIPHIMSSYEFDDNDQGPPTNSNGSICSPHSDNNDKCVNGYVCEHRFYEIFITVRFGNLVKNEKIKNHWCNEKDQVAFALGIQFFVVFNWGNEDLRQKLYTGLPDGTYCDILTGGLDNGKCCGKSVIIKGGSALFEVPAVDLLGMRAFHIDEAILDV